MFQALEHAPLELFTNSLSAQTQSTWSDLKLDRQPPSIVDLLLPARLVILEDQVFGLGRKLLEALVQAAESLFGIVELVWRNREWLQKSSRLLLRVPPFMGDVACDGIEVDRRIFCSNLFTFDQAAGNPVDRLVGQLLSRATASPFEERDQLSLNPLVLLTGNLSIRIERLQKSFETCFRQQHGRTLHHFQSP